MELTANVVHEYIEYCEREKRLDWKTLKAYRTDLRQFLEYLQAEKLEFTREAVKGCAARMNERFKPRTVRRKLASVRALTTWLVDEKRLPRNPFENLRVKLREPRLLPRVLPLRVVGRMLAAARQAADGGLAALCEAAVLETLFATGIRVSELCGLRARDVDLREGVFYIFGKGKKERVIPVENAEVLGLLRRYAREASPELDAPFFRSRRGTRLSEQSVRRIVRKYGKQVDYPTRITPHMFRHTVATLLLENDVDLRYIQQFLGHASILTTQIYTHVAPARQRDILRERHPRNAFTFEGK